MNLREWAVLDNTQRREYISGLDDVDFLQRQIDYLQNTVLAYFDRKVKHLPPDKFMLLTSVASREDITAAIEMFKLRLFELTKE